jgi:hypothetical protein
MSFRRVGWVGWVGCGWDFGCGTEEDGMGSRDKCAVFQAGKTYEVVHSFFLGPATS